MCMLCADRCIKWVSLIEAGLLRHLLLESNRVSNKKSIIYSVGVQNSLVILYDLSRVQTRAKD